MPDTRTAAREELETLLAGIVPTLKTLDLSSPKVAAALTAAHPPEGPGLARVRALCEAGLAEGWLVPKQAGPTCRFGRLVKDLDGYAVDCVLMSGKALGHRHPNGEVNLCLAWEGAPRFDGHPPGWVVFPPGSRHVPTVTGGTMMFVYFLPGAAVEWDPPPTR
jgi:hypothetical protein